MQGCGVCPITLGDNFEILDDYVWGKEQLPGRDVEAVCDEVTVDEPNVNTLMQYETGS